MWHRLQVFALECQADQQRGIRLRSSELQCSVIKTLALAQTHSVLINSVRGKNDRGALAQGVIDKSTDRLPCSEGIDRPLGGVVIHRPLQFMPVDTGNEYFITRSGELLTQALGGWFTVHGDIRGHAAAGEVPNQVEHVVGQAHLRCRTLLG